VHDEPAEEFLPFPTKRHLVRPANQVRSTLLMSSQKTLRDEGLFTEYEGYLAPEHRDAILDLTAPCWLPMELGLAHYAACDRLGLSPSRVVEIAQRVSMRAEGTFLGVALGVARGVGVTPWTVLSQMRRIWDRAFVGGGVAVYKLGGQQARLEIVAWPCVRIDYCRHAFRGLALGVTALLSSKPRVRELSLSPGVNDGIAYEIVWD
jgi:hypothetical protein